MTFLIAVIGVVVALLAGAAVIDLRDRRRGHREESPGRIWRRVRETRRDMRVYDRATQGNLNGPDTDWMDHRRR